jgi:hypothetical protein
MTSKFENMMAEKEMEKIASFEAEKRKKEVNSEGSQFTQLLKVLNQNLGGGGSSSNPASMSNY